MQWRGCSERQESLSASLMRGPGQDGHGAPHYGGAGGGAGERE